MQKSSLSLNKIFLWAICLCVYAHVFSQNKSDRELIMNKKLETHKYDSRKVSYIFKDSKNVLVKYNPISLTFGGLMLFYQKVLSQQILSECPYEISCSNFSKAVIKRYGIIKGIALTADRLLRCNGIAAKDIGVYDLSPQMKIVDSPEKYHF